MMMIERAARALCHEIGADPDATYGGPHPSGQWVKEGTPWWTGYIGEMRAVITAVRDQLDESGLVEAACLMVEREGSGDAQIAVDAYEAIIDLIDRAIKGSATSEG